MGNVSNTKTITMTGYSEQMGPDCTTVRTYHTPTTRTWTDSRSGSNNPNYKQLIADGLSATGELSGSKGELIYKPGLWEYRSDPSKSWTYPCAKIRPYIFYTTYYDSLPTLPAIPTDTGLENEAKSKGLTGIHGRIRSQSTKFSGMVMIGEIRETARLIRSPARAMRERTGIFASKADKLRKQKRSQSTADAFAESWLEYSFGISPLINDITGISEALRDRMDTGITRLSYTGHAETASHIKVNSGLRPWWNVRFMRSTVDKYQAIYTVGHKAEVQANNSIDRLIDAGGFGLNEVIPTAWELVPWSFLVDYFLNIGDILSAATTSTVGVRWSQLTLRKERKVTESGFHLGYLPPWTNYLTSSVRMLKQPYSVGKRTSVTRGDVDLTIPSLQFELPGGNAKFLNMAALAKLKIR